MSKVLLVDRSDADVAPLADQLAGGGARVLVASGGLYALTMLEREQPQLLLTRFDLGDMTGPELCEVIKSDDQLAGVQVVLLAGDLEQKRAAERAGGFDLVLLDDRPPTRLAASLRRLIERGPRPVPPDPGPGADTAGPSGESPAGGDETIAGTLGVLNFAELSQAFAQAGKTGRLELEIGAGEPPSVVLFDGGRVRHATFRHATGTPAFARLYYETERARGIAFRFQPMTPDAMSSQPRTLDHSAQQLLLNAAVDLDHYHTAEMPVIRRDDLESLAPAADGDVDPADGGDGDT